MVPVVRGPEIVKSGCPEKSNFMMVPAASGPQIVKLESWNTQKVEVGSRPFKGVHRANA